MIKHNLTTYIYFVTAHYAAPGHTMTMVFSSCGLLL